MIKNENIREIVDLLSKEKSGPCVSVIVNTHRLSPERRADALQVARAVGEAKGYLQANYSSSQAEYLSATLDELYNSIDFDHNLEGIGLFASTTVKQLVKFSFPVKEKVIVGNSFETRDLLFEDYYAITYYLLHISENEARLYRGSLQSLEEVIDGNFPVKHEEEYIYDKPSRSSSYRGYANVSQYEKDKTLIEESRFKSFLKNVDASMAHYLSANTPLVIAGAKKDLAYFYEITRHKQNIAGNIPGNYLYNSLHERAVLGWEVVHSFLNGEKEKLIANFKECIGLGRTVTGITEVWRAAKEGRGLTLLVEKDFSGQAYVLKNDDYVLHVHEPHAPCRTIPDAVNELIEIVLEKNGSVVFTENDSLKEYYRVALITRY